ncbi:MAG TPA: GNAT family N-acetyltransferase [Anaerolineales bacterium]|nr:GNAT family N-acetyltransferase [Anaerolineales bacterium]
MSIKILILHRGDESVLDHVDSDVFDDPIHPQAAKEFLTDNRHHLAVAMEKDIVIGFASGVHYIHPDKSSPEFWINEVGVSRSYQKRGVGKALMHALFEKARSLGCAEAWVLTERDNVPAMRLYQSIGGEEAPEETVMFTFHL